MTIRFLALLLAALTCAPSLRMSAQTLDKLAKHALTYSQKQLTASVAALSDSALFPRSTREDGTWKTVPPGDWTSGFFAGCLWLTHEATHDAFFRRAAERWTAGMEAQQFNRTTHDLGFMMNDSYGQGYRLYPSEPYKRVLLQTAQTLASRFNSTVGCTRSWDNPAWQFPVIIDNMMNLELLFWASKNGGDPAFRALAVAHARRTMKEHVRADGSTYHLVDFDTATGAVLKKQTVQGWADESAWARGQAWALYGFTVAYRETKDAQFLATAERVADFFIDHLPADHIPYWDFRAPGIPDEPRDASAAAIASSGLFELRRLTKDAYRRLKYSTAAKQILAALCKPPYLSEGTPSMGIVNHAVGHKPAGTEIDVSLVYGDYYFLEALRRYRAGMPSKTAPQKSADGILK